MVYFRGFEVELAVNEHGPVLLRKAEFLGQLAAACITQFTVQRRLFG